MRIISQDGMIDIPYERFIISVSMQNQGEVIAWTGNSISDDECIVMAVYSSLVKVQKAMEMLHSEWDDCGINGRFQFPSDDELEV